jgi:subtilase family serine protease
MLKTRWAVGVAMTGLMLLGAPAISALAASTRTALPGSAPAWAAARNFVQAADGSEDVGFRVYLGWQDENQLVAFDQAVSTPGNASYHKFLTPAQFHQLYSPPQASVAAVTKWLQGAGFHVNYVPGNNHYVSAEGTVAQATAAFGVSFGMYRIAGLELRSPSAALTVPTSLSSDVSGVLGLDDSAQLVHTNLAGGNSDPGAPPPAAFVSASPCSSYWGQNPATGFQNPYGAGAVPYAPCGYTPQQVKGAYGLTGATQDGTGQTVAIIDAYASPTILQDANQWSVNRGLPAFSGHQFSQVVSPGTYNHPESGQKQDPQGWYGEETLDVEAVHGMAPGANVSTSARPTTSRTSTPPSTMSSTVTWPRS